VPAPSAGSSDFLGEASLAIFLTHTIVGGAVRLVLRQFDLLTAPVYVALATILGLALPAIAHYVVLRLGLSTGLPLARYAGFGTARTSVYLPLRRAADPQVQRIVAD
jgi:fucose 4-O-acetylase-like acetyltransferase